MRSGYLSTIRVLYFTEFWSSSKKSCFPRQSPHFLSFVMIGGNGGSVVAEMGRAAVAKTLDWKGFDFGLWAHFSL